MTKPTIGLRLSPECLANLAEIHRLSGATRNATIELAVAWLLACFGDFSIVAHYLRLLAAANAVLAILGDDDLPDNGNLSGAAVTDMLRAALANHQE